MHSVRWHRAALLARDCPGTAMTAIPALTAPKAIHLLELGMAAGCGVSVCGVGDRLRYVGSKLVSEESVAP